MIIGHIIRLWNDIDFSETYGTSDMMAHFLKPPVYIYIYVVVHINEECFIKDLITRRRG